MSHPARRPRTSRRWRTLLACGLLAATALAHATAGDPDEPAAATRVEADVRFLADDLLEGRATGTRGHELAALFVASRFRALGLQPAGNNGSYYQQVPLLSGVRDPAGARFELHRGTDTRAFRFVDDFLAQVNFTTGSAEVSAPLVFVGHGVRAPELGYDDLAGIDVKDRIAVLFSNAPARFPDDQRAFHSDSNEKYRELERLGAIGVITVFDPATSAHYPWSQYTDNWQQPSMRMLDPGGVPVDDFPGLRVRVTLNITAAQTLFAGADQDFAEVTAALARNELRSFALPGTATLATRGRLQRLSSPNVIARLPGADPVLAAEHVLLSAHLDHLGIGAPHAGDTIYNGAMDNALGVAIMLEAARRLGADATPPRRSTLFIATTAEEAGLYGAEHFASHPTVPVDSLVASINMDMPVAQGGLVDVVPVGIEHSSLRAVAERAVAEAGLSLSKDPFPEEVGFVRSDQYAFVRAGVPSLYLDGGIRPGDGSDGIARLEAFLTERYHQPSDDTTAPIDWAYAARLARVNYRMARIVADAPQRPAWTPGDFFGERFGRR